MVEHQFSKLDVVGSSPISRSIFWPKGDDGVIARHVTQVKRNTLVIGIVRSNAPHAEWGDVGSNPT